MCIESVFAVYVSPFEILNYPTFTLKSKWLMFKRYLLPINHGHL